MITLVLEPGVVMSWADFLGSKPPYSIALDGYVSGPPLVDLKGPYANFNHHEGVTRLGTRSTCAQVFFSLRLGLYDLFSQDGKPRAQVFINDIDQDVCLSWWLLQHPEKLTGLGFESHLLRLILFEDILDTTAGAYPSHPDSSAMRKQAWIFQPYTDARCSRKLYLCQPAERLEIVAEVGRRLDSVAAGSEEELSLDSEYEIIGGGAGWKLIKETGSHARTRLFAEGTKAFVSLVIEEHGVYTYSIGKMSPFVRFPLERMYDRLNLAEGKGGADRWGGSDTIGGSPRMSGSRLRPQDVERIVNECIAEITQ
ncbi:MAG TPA: hypothetical protein VK445_08955 [Dissulfurispiraceae bacterium]|nr:hypothetical protein [Dissulfurispiraceae bacterium]